MTDRPKTGISTAGDQDQPGASGSSWTSDVRRLWEGADYPAVAEHLEAAAYEVAKVSGPGGRGQSLDLATGTGSVALALADAGWQVTAVDLAPALMSVGRRRAAERGREVEWVQASIDDVPVSDASVDLITSGFGLIFAPDPQEALAEAHRILRPGGLLVFSAWTPAGTMGRMTGRIGQFLGRSEAFMAPFGWGEPATVDAWLQPGFTDVQHRHHLLPWAFHSPDTATQWLFDRSPGHRAALEAAGERGPALVETVGSWMIEVAGGDRAFDLSPEYLITSARRTLRPART